MININYYNIPQNEHFWTDLNQLLHYIKTTNEIDNNYLRIGLYNTQNYGLDIVEISKKKNRNYESMKYKPFISINQIFLFLISPYYNLLEFEKRIKCTLKEGFNISFVSTYKYLMYKEKIKLELQNIKCYIGESELIFDKLYNEYNGELYSSLINLIKSIDISSNNILKRLSLFNTKYNY